MIKISNIRLKPRSRGFHLITNEIENQLMDLPKEGLAHLFLNHTSAALTINENADPTVRDDFEQFINDLVPEDYPEFLHTMEGPDDMPAHIKSSIFGTELTIPVQNGRLLMGTWQGIYLCEFRNAGGARSITATVMS
ncbi:MAG: secondary thiamine-phosphate synthase enzyme YjbQ [Salinivirgaceae bacterium]|jgi:secondary thiamine-phosphate synthase enzyme|nr:secondary thiamine-phosphate synthase enzyme YjbQ [Salinivirgaceae bacterium]